MNKKIRNPVLPKWFFLPAAALCLLLGMGFAAAADFSDTGLNAPANSDTAADSAVPGPDVPADSDAADGAAADMSADPADFCVVVASDPHYIAPSLTDGGASWLKTLEQGDSKFMPYAEEILDAFMEETAALQPDAVILTGDLTFNGAVMSHEAFSDRLRTLETKVFVLPGNHDMYNVNAARFHGNSYTRIPFATEKTFAAVWDDFGRKDALSRDPDSLSYMAALTPGTRLLMLDFNTLSDYCGISEKSLAWVEEQLREAREAGDCVLAAGHQNLFRHTVFLDGYVIERTEALQALFRTYGVRLFLSGHLHVQHIVTESGLTEIASSCLVSYPCRYGVLTMKDGVLSYETRQLDLAAWAERHGRTDPVFADFPAAAAQYMKDHFKAGDDDWLQELNVNYFAGDLQNIDTSGAETYLEGDGLISMYVESVLSDIGKDFNHWKEKQP